MNKTLQNLLVGLIVLGGSLARPVMASFEALPVGARAAGMADAYTMAADDNLSLYYNPAGLAHIRRPEVGSYYSRLVMGLTDNSEVSRSYLGFAHPLKNNLGVVGASYINVGLPGLYNEQTYGLSYAKGLTRRLNVGATAKMLRRSFGVDAYTENAINVDTGEQLGGRDPLFSAGTAKSAVSFDLGAQWRLNRLYALGVAVRNFNQPNMAIGADSDRAPSIYTVGAGRWTKTSSLSMEVLSQNFAGGRDSRVSLGGERWFKKGIGVRAGAALGTRAYGNLAAGASYRMDGFQFDYAINFPLSGLDTTGSHMVSLTFRFGKPAPDPLETELIENRDARLKAEAEGARLRKQLNDLTNKPLDAPDGRKLNSAVQDALKAAQDELERLRGQAPLSSEPMEEEAAPAPAPVPADVTPEPVKRAPAPATKPRPARKTITPGLLSQFSESLKFYADQVKAGVPVEERVSTLERILAKYENQGIDTSGIRSELKKLKSQNSRVVTDFSLAVNYYRRIVQQGTTSDERTILLERIVKKYKPLGMDTAELEKELENLRSGQ